MIATHSPLLTSCKYPLPHIIIFCMYYWLYVLLYCNLLLYFLRWPNVNFIVFIFYNLAVNFMHCCWTFLCFSDTANWCEGNWLICTSKEHGAAMRIDLPMSKSQLVCFSGCAYRWRVWLIQDLGSNGEARYLETQENTAWAVHWIL